MKTRSVLMLAILAVVLCCLPLSAATYYVSQSSGNDEWPGTAEQPWKTLWRASQLTYQPRDQILLKRGDTWSDEADPGKCELVVKGDGDLIAPNFITVAAYGGDPNETPRPHIHHPSKDTTPGIINWQGTIDWVAAHPGTGFDFYRDRNFVRIAIKINGNGWKIKDIEISNAEMGICNGPTATHWRPTGIGYTIESCYLHDMKGLSWPRHPDYPNAFLGGDPIAFGALNINGENVILRDCVIDKNFDPNFAGGDGITGIFYNALFENLYIDKMYAGGMHFSEGNNLTIRNCTILNGEYGEPPIGGCYYGPCVFDLAHMSDFTFENSEIGYVNDYGDFADEEAISIFGQNAGLVIRNSYFHDARCAPFAFHYNGMTLGDETGMNRYVLLENNVTYHNGLETVYQKERAAFSGDIMVPNGPSSGYTGLTDIAFKNNRIYKGFAENPDQTLQSYRDVPPLWYNDFKIYPTYSFPTAGEDANEIYEYNAYTDWPPLPKVMPDEPAQGTNITRTAGMIGASGDPLALCDGNYTTSWRPETPYNEKFASFSWESPQTIDRIRLYDRPEPYHCARWVRINFSDGSEYTVYGGLQDNGAMREIILDKPKTVTHVKFTITRWEGEPGLSEIKIYKNSVAPALPQTGDGAVDFNTAKAARLTGLYDGIDWGNTDWRVRGNGGVKNSRCLFIDFPPLKSYVPLAYNLRKTATRTFFLPAGKKLKSIAIQAPTGAAVIVSQTGAGSLGMQDFNGSWKNVTLDWTTPVSNQVRIVVSTNGVTNDKKGVYDVVRFDDITYGD